MVICGEHQRARELAQQLKHLPLDQDPDQDAQNLHRRQL